MRRFALVVAAFACAPPNPNAAPPSGPPRPTRSGPACDSVVQRVALAPDSFSTLRPTPQFILVPPPPPPEVRGHRIDVTVRVDERGHVEPGSVTITGIANAEYERTFRERLLAYRFIPAVLDGCAVPAPFSIGITP